MDIKVPPMPQTLLAAVEMMDSDDLNVPDVVKLIEADPAVVTRVLRIANSAFAAQRAEITSTRRAVVVLGPNAVLGLVMSMGMVEMKADFDEEVTLPFLEIVRHSVAVAVIARIITEEDGADSDAVGEAFAAGLLHDLGKLVLLYNSPAQASPLYRSGVFGYALLTEEEKLLGTNHTRIGAVVAEQLRLPRRLRDVMFSHHSDNGEATESTAIVNCIRQANAVAHVLGFPEQPGPARNVMHAEIDEGYWKSRRSEIERYVDAVV